MRTFFTSDTHFGDHRVLRIDRRPFASLDEHDKALVSNWNVAIGESDEVWHLGDFAAVTAREAVDRLLSELNGVKHLVIGNNDPEATVASRLWASRQHYAELTVHGTRLVLCHYPFRTWNRMSRGVINLHGHSHGRLTPMPRQYDVGVDAMAYRPAEIGTILRQRRRGRAR